MFGSNRGGGFGWGTSNSSNNFTENHYFQYTFSYILSLWLCENWKFCIPRNLNIFMQNQIAWSIWCIMEWLSTLDQFSFLRNHLLKHFHTTFESFNIRNFCGQKLLLIDIGWYQSILLSPFCNFYLGLFSFWGFDCIFFIVGMYIKGHLFNSVRTVSVISYSTFS